MNEGKPLLTGLGDLAAACPTGAADNTRFLGWLGTVVERVRNLPRGRTLLLPGGWCTRAGGRGLHSFPFQLNLSFSVGQMTQLNSSMCPLGA